jgi:hypothetical protein
MQYKKFTLAPVGNTVLFPPVRGTLSHMTNFVPKWLSSQILKKNIDLCAKCDEIVALDGTVF